MSSQSFLLKIDASSKLFQQLLEEDSELSIVQSGDVGLIYSSELASLVSLSSELPPNEYSIETLEEKVWRDTWTLDLEPVIISSLNLKIIPQINQSISIPKLSANEIVLFPGRSFGIGHHETTKITLELMGQFKELFTGAKVLDFGCGSGILGIVASILGAKEVLAVDIEDDAINATNINAKLNNIKNIATAKSVEGNFDILLINTILAVTEIEFPKLKSKLLAGTKIFASGFLINQLEQVTKILRLQETKNLLGEEWGSVFGTTKPL